MSETQQIKLRRDWDKRADFNERYRAFQDRFSHAGDRGYSFNHGIEKWDFVTTLVEGQTGYDRTLEINLDLGSGGGYPIFKLWLTVGEPGFGADSWLFRGFAQRQKVFKHTTGPIQGLVEGFIRIGGTTAFEGDLIFL